MSVKILSILPVLSVLFHINITLASDWNWSSPLAHNAVQGRVDIYSENDFGRLPSFLEKEVREPVWRLGQQSAGLYIDFETDSDTVLVRYQLNGSLNMPHMPTTGVSGVDLYTFDESTKTWGWAYGKYSFKDTITFEFSQIAKEGNSKYRLYLPLYNSVKELEIGVPASTKIEYQKETAAPILIYGTSIAQGACASRPGTAWTNILNRKLNTPVVNLGFSGNGRLEQPILDLMSQQNASIYVLDCLPNLGVNNVKEEENLMDLIENAVMTLRKQNVDIPIILTEHSAGFSTNMLNRWVNERAEKTNEIGRKAIRRLQGKGIDKLFLLPNTYFQMDIDSTVDYVHPNDIGMKKIAQGYYKFIKEYLGF